LSIQIASPNNEWIDPQDWTERDEWLAITARRKAYEADAAELWERIKTSVRNAVDAVNSDLPESLRLALGDATQGGLALTRFHHPLAFVDLTIDVESGMIGGLYTSAPRPGDAYREHFNVWLIRSTDQTLYLTDAQGHGFESLDAMARQVIAPCFANVVRCSVETGTLGPIGRSD
jgi:hypothetical protein